MSVVTGASVSVGGGVNVDCGDRADSVCSGSGKAAMAVSMMSFAGARDLHAAAGSIAECEYADCDDGQEQKLDNTFQAAEARLAATDKLRFLVRSTHGELPRGNSNTSVSGSFAGWRRVRQTVVRLASRQLRCRVRLFRLGLQRRDCAMAANRRSASVADRISRLRHRDLSAIARCSSEGVESARSAYVSWFPGHDQRTGWPFVLIDARLELIIGPLSVNSGQFDLTALVNPDIFKVQSLSRLFEQDSHFKHRMAKQ